MRSITTSARVPSWQLRAVAAGLLLALSALVQPAHAGLFDDEEARRAILDLRSRVDQTNEQSRRRDADLSAQITAQQAALTDQLAQLRRSLLELNNEIETLRSDNARLRGQNEQLTRDLAEVQRNAEGHPAGRRRAAAPVRAADGDGRGPRGPGRPGREEGLRGRDGADPCQRLRRCRHLAGAVPAALADQRLQGVGATTGSAMRSMRGATARPR